MEKIEKFSAIKLIKNNYKYVLSILATIIMAVVLYTNAVDLPKKFLVLLFLIASILIIFLPRKIEYAAIAIILVMGGMSALISPINDIPDEYVHQARVVYIADGDFVVVIYGVGHVPGFFTFWETHLLHCVCFFIDLS